MLSDRVESMLDRQPELAGQIMERSGSKSKIVEEEELEIQSSEAERISRVKLEGGKRQGWYIKKEYEEGRQVKDQLEKYKWLKDKGYPVPKRAFEGPGVSLLVSDLTENNKKQVYSVNNWSEGVRKRLRNMEEIGEQLKEVVEKAKNDEVMITMDSYFLVVEPDERRGEVVIGDFGAAGIGEEEERDLGYESKEAVKEAAEAFYQVVSKRFARDENGKVIIGGGNLWKK